ncbi:MAG: flagellar hook-length control protein FliK [Candidatus Poribacteria bacterium]|nr:flagellar hook-length control protein FliK [Candidatus Poribacteria bacterium]
MFWQSVSTQTEANTSSSAKLTANNVQEVGSGGSGFTGPLFSELLSTLIAGIEDPKIQAALNSQNQTFNLGSSFTGELQPMSNLLNGSQQQVGLTNQNLFQPSISYHHDGGQLSISVAFPGLDNTNGASVDESVVMDQWHFTNIPLSPELSIDRLSELVSFTQGFADSSSTLKSSPMQDTIRSRVEHLKNALWVRLSTETGLEESSAITPNLQVAVDDDMIEIGIVGRDFSISLPKTAFLETEFPSESIASVMAIPFLFSLNDTNQLPTDTSGLESDSVALISAPIESLNKLIHQNLTSAATDKIMPAVELGIKPMGKDAVIQVVEQKLSIQLPQAEITHPNFPLEQLAGTMTPLLSHLQAVDHLPLSSALEGAQQIVAGEDFMSSNSFNQDRAVLATASSLEESSSILPIAQSTDSTEPANTMLRSSSTATQMAVDYLSDMASEKIGVDPGNPNSSQLSLSAEISGKHIRLEFQADLPRHLESITQKIEQIVNQNQQNNPTSTVEMLQSHAQRLASTTNVAVTGQMDPELELDLKDQQIESIEVKSAKIDVAPQPIVQKGFAQLRRQGYQLFQRLQGNVEQASANLADEAGSGEISAQLDVAAEFEEMFQSQIGSRVASTRDATFTPINSAVQNLGGSEPILQNIEVGAESLAMSQERTIQEARQQMIEEIQSHRQLARGSGSREVTIRLRPEYLGRLIVRVINQNEEIAVQIRATTAEAQNLLVSELADLSVTLQEQGIRLGNLDISVIGSGNDSQQPDDRSSQFSDQQKQSNPNSNGNQDENREFESEMNQDMSHDSSDDDSGDLNLVI